MSTQIHNVDTAVFFFKWPTICPQNRTKKDGKVILKFLLAVYLIGLDISIPLNNQYVGVFSGQGQTLQREKQRANSNVTEADELLSRFICFSILQTPARVYLNWSKK